MRANISQKTLIIGIFLFLLLLLAGNASSQVDPVYAGWTVGNSWGGYGTILRSADSGETWIRQGDGQIVDVDMKGVFAVDPYTAWLVGGSHDGYATIYHTTDGGSTWERMGSSDQESPEYVPNAWLLKVTAYGDSKVWAVGPSTILHTNDGGATWTDQTPTGCEGIQLQGVHTPDGTNVWVTAGDSVNGYALILKSTDAGLNWTRQSGGDVVNWEHILGISAVDADMAWAIAARQNDMESGVLVTTDGGATWTTQMLAGLDGNEVCAVDASTVWAVSDTTIHWSSDGGVKWGHYTSAAYTMGISAVSSQEAWAVSIGEANYKEGTIYHTDDGGSTWTVLKGLGGEKLTPLFTISFATPKYLIISLIEDVELLVDGGLLNKGQGNAFIVKLEKFLDRLANDRPNAAINALDAFSNQVEAFIQGGILPLEDGQDLLDQVNNIFELFFSPL